MASSSTGGSLGPAARRVAPATLLVAAGALLTTAVAVPSWAQAPAPVPAAAAAEQVVHTARPTTYPVHTRIPATTFWVGEVFDPDAADGSQVISTYDSGWLRHFGGCDGKVRGGTCGTERRRARNGWFPRHMTPRENPFYLDLPFDDLNDPAAFAQRCDVVPWAGRARYATRCDDSRSSLMKNRWVAVAGPSGRTCFGQVEDAGPGVYDDVAYVFGADDARPANRRYGAAGMDVSPALNGCLGFASLDGTGDLVDWRFVDSRDVPRGPWRRVVTRRGVVP